MSFFFKSKKGQQGAPSGIPPRKITSREGLNGGMPGTFSPAAVDERSGSAGSNPIMGAMSNRSAPSPTPESRHMIPRNQPSEPMRQGPRRPPQDAPPDPSRYPWSKQKLSFFNNANPFPRYGASVNAQASANGDIYMMGGLIDGSHVRGDLWIVEARTSPMQCYQIEADAEGPGPRVGHASLLVGNAFIVFGGDTKIEETDPLDDTLYLLNTATKHWSRVAPAGPRPAGRYGHTLNIISSKIFVFGGQVEGYFYNDLVAFDLNALQDSGTVWETLIQNTADGGPTQGQVPMGRTNHTIVTYDDKLYLFGGTDGVRWFNDVWMYDPRVNGWTLLECIGFIPAAREGHSAALVGDVMYIFGGRTEEGKDLDDVTGFRIPTRRWYTFQNMGPNPSPRSGHGMIAYDSKILVLGGEPSSAPRNEVELSDVYILDTAKIRYPENRGPSRTAAHGRRPSVTDRSGTPQQDRTGSRDGSISSQQQSRSLATKTSEDSLASSVGQYSRPQDAPSTGYVNGIMQKPPARSAPSPVPPQTLSQPPSQSRINGIRPGVQTVGMEGRESPRMVSKIDKILGSNDMSTREIVPGQAYNEQRDRSTSQPQVTNNYQQPQVNNNYQQPQEDSYGAMPRQQPQQSQQPQNTYQQQQQQPPLYESNYRRGTETPETGTRVDDFIQSSFKQPTYADSGVGSSPALSTQQQPEGSVKELEAMRSKNAWYASELALAKKAGYRSSSLDNDSSPLDEKAADAFGDDEKPLLEALLRMRAELVRVQQSLEIQSASAAERMAQVEREKQAAVQEALYARQQLRNRSMSEDDSEVSSSRLDDAHGRLASTLNAHSDLKAQIQSLSEALDAERRAREAAESSADAAHQRASELDSHKQWSAPELESLRAQLREAQRSARDDAARSAEAVASSRSLGVDKKELTSKLSTHEENHRSHANILRTLREAVHSSTEKTSLIERQLEKEREHRTFTDQKLSRLRAEHESKVAELDSVTRQLEDAQALTETHAREALAHKEAVLAGIGNHVDRDFDPSEANDERVSILQQQLQEAEARASQLKDQADHESERRRRAEERIAGLEAFQEQQGRESLSFRKQLQSATRDHSTLQSRHAELEQELNKHKLDVAAWQMQHEALKGVLSDHGVDTSALPKDLSELQLNSSNNKRMQQLEEQIEASARAQEEMRQTYEHREAELRQSRDAEYQALQRECQQMRTGIDKFNSIASRMKKEIDGQKSTNKRLQEELENERRTRSQSSNYEQNTADFEKERMNFRQLVDNLQTRLKKSQSEYESQMGELQTAMSERDMHQERTLQLERELESTKGRTAESETLRSENDDLRQRMAEAENRIQMLLETAGMNVNNRRQSEVMAPPQLNGAPGSSAHNRDPSTQSLGAESNYSAASNGTYVDNRGSLAQMEAMMNELDTIRGDFERQRQGYHRSRLSETSFIEGPGPTAESGEDPSAKVSSLADMRRRHLSFNEEDEGAGEEERSQVLNRGPSKAQGQ